MIKNIQIIGFKCFDCVNLELNNLTLLAGQNSKGKTTIIQALLAMMQDGNNPFRGEYMNIGEPEELENVIVGSRKIEISVSYEKDEDVKKETKTIENGKVAVEGNGLVSNDIKVVYCSADRIGVKDTYEKYLGDEIIIGKNCEYAFHYLSEHGDETWNIENDFIYDEESKLTFGGQVNYWLEKIIGYWVTAKKIDKTELVRVLYNNKLLYRDVRPKNVGTGVTYIAEVIIAALSCKKGDLLIIENPEIHLHPSGQGELIKFLSYLAQWGVQIIMETHSDHVYNGVRKGIHLDWIEHENVNIYFFTQKEDGCTIPVKIPLNSEGKALEHEDGLFDQIKKDLDVILGW